MVTRKSGQTRAVWPISIVVWVLTWRDDTSIATGNEATLASTVRWWQHSLSVVTGQLIPTHNSFPQNRILHTIWTTQLARQLDRKLVINNTDYTSLTTVRARLTYSVPRLWNLGWYLFYYKLWQMQKLLKLLVNTIICFLSHMCGNWLFEHTMVCLLDWMCIYLSMMWICMWCRLIS